MSSDKRPHREVFAWRSRGSFFEADSSISRVVDSLIGVSLVHPTDIGSKTLDVNYEGVKETFQSPDKSVGASVQHPDKTVEAADVLCDGAGLLNGLEGNLIPSVGVGLQCEAHKGLIFHLNESP